MSLQGTDIPRDWKSLSQDFSQESKMPYSKEYKQTPKFKAERSAYMKKYWAEHPEYREKEKLRKRKWRAKNRAWANLRACMWRWQNPEKAQASQQRNYQRNGHKWQKNRNKEQIQMANIMRRIKQGRPPRNMAKLKEQIALLKKRLENEQRT